MGKLQNKSVLVTGSSMGIGRATVLAFAKQGCRVAITYYEDEERGQAEEVGTKCLEAGASDAMVLQLNVMDDASIRRTVKAVAARYGTIAVLVNNAGVAYWKKLKEQSFDEIRLQVRTNLEGLIKMTRESLPHVTDCIVNIASGAGITAYAELSTYCATKFGVRGFTHALAEELAGVKVFAVNPGMTATRLTNFEGQPPERVGNTVVDAVARSDQIKSGSDINVWD